MDVFYTIESKKRNHNRYYRFFPFKKFFKQFLLDKIRFSTPPITFNL